MLKGIKINKPSEEEKDSNSKTNNDIDSKDKVKNTIINEKAFIYNFLGKKLPSIEDIKNTEQPFDKKYQRRFKDNNQKKLISEEEIERIKNNSIKPIQFDYSFNYIIEINQAFDCLLKNKINDFHQKYSKLDKNISNQVLNNVDKEKILKNQSLEENINNNYNNNNIIKTTINKKPQNNEEIILNSDLNLYNGLNKIDINKNKVLKPCIKFDYQNKILLLKSCYYCISNQYLPKNVISTSQNIYLAYPFSFGSITEYHLILSSHEHFNSAAALTEESYTELRNYMKSITAFNAERNYSTIFIEYSKSISQSNHFIIEAIPIKHKKLEEVKIFYKKALSEQDTDWSDNKQIVETSNHRGNIKKILNENFSYIHVDFNCGGGYLHVVSDQNRFNGVYLKEILSVALNKSSFEIKNPIKINGTELYERVDKYKTEFEKFDWTKYC